MALMIVWNIDPMFPTTIEPIPTIIPIPERISVNVQAQPFPFHNP